ncbi:threonine aspartase 1 isoform X2 [Chrysoperla carnea]|uniref:threonine aspartase 1 isoform X2 n=1 Tax=Chrysoperla carnea TaxID=189513 RepID=UPI001D05E1C1|nr:threonine aspartase 1 isoform X2 [Chrysoperla carnea]
MGFIALHLVLEDDPLVNCGYGSNLTMDGTVECDASIMDGTNMHFGACGAVSGVKNPIELAYKLCHNQSKESILVAPCILVGDGAYQFAINEGLPLIEKEKLISAKAYKVYKKYKRYLNEYNNHIKKRQESEENSSEVVKPKIKVIVNTNKLSPVKNSKRKVEILDVESSTKKMKDNEDDLENSDDLEIGKRYDTVGAVCIDNNGCLVSGVSSGGIILKQRGRIGQACIFGAGIWSDENVAVSTTGCGEHIIKTNLAKEIAGNVMDSEFNLVETLKLKYTDSPILKHEKMEKIAGAIVVNKTEKNCGIFSWGHTDRHMGVGYMSTDDDSPKICISSDYENIQSTTFLY